MIACQGLIRSMVLVFVVASWFQLLNAINVQQNLTVSGMGTSVNALKATLKFSENARLKTRLQIQREQSNQPKVPAPSEPTLINSNKNVCCVQTDAFHVKTVTTANNVDLSTLTLRHQRVASKFVETEKDFLWNVTMETTSMATDAVQTVN